MAAAAISVEHVSKRFGAIHAVDDVTFDVEPGTIVALLGPNGAGKTTLISMILGLSQPTHGSVRVFGHRPRDRAARERLGVMLQNVTLPQSVKVKELVAWFRSFYPHPLPADNLLQMAGIEHLAEREAVKLSGGEQRRLQFALAMAGDPALLLLDEPTTGMDVESRRAFWDSLRSFVYDGRRTLLLTTHHLEEAESVADRVILLKGGRVIADGSLAEIKAQAGHRYVSFIAGPRCTKEEIEQLPYVRSVRYSGRHVRIETDRPDDVLRAIILRDLDASSFEVSQGALEDAFVALTELDDRLEERGVTR
ncbi:ABC transporter ATP-binding protein [Alicyclobacillus acidocaldarius]|uniref:ABC transporter related protein n=1 Tax=Alicyclobacillus acidocaldarius (strain Tc-4-1) TaxID=1048834 RepID=F8IDB2_ALIAT|nr:ABC transporter ATP-binding protein [Alicyclobacillus acidocaldarius]AEJ42578.1 ABC transporter related protein [Alicyclobacillus acidocaldarius subsp. acidocaldarius Tc-4-1]